MSLKVQAGYTDWSNVISDVDPYAWAFVGAGLAIGLSVLGAAWGIFITGSSLLGAAVREKRIMSKNLIRCLPLVLAGARSPGQRCHTHGRGSRRVVARWHLI